MSTLPVRTRRRGAVTRTARVLCALAVPFLATLSGGLGRAADAAPFAAAPFAAAPFAAAPASASTAPADASPHDTPAGAASAPESAPAAAVDVIEISGQVDRIQARFIIESLDRAARDGALALVIQLDSGGSVLPAAELEALEAALAADHRVPLAVWIGPLDARATGGAVRIVRAADIVGMAPLTRVGRSTPPTNGSDPLEGRVVEQRVALREHLAEIDAPVLRTFVAALDDRTVDGHRIDTARVVIEDGKPKTRDGLEVREVFATPRFGKLALLPRLLHTVSNPSIAFLLLVIGLALVVFEFYTGGVGVAAAVAVIALVLAAFGLGALPLTGWALAALLLSFVAFAVDVQSGVPRFWTVVAVVSFVVGSLFLYRGGLSVPWYWIGIVGFLLVVFMTNGMPSMIRTRFATPTIGRASMIGETGHVSGDAIRPDGVVIVRGAPWRARTNRATPIPEGAEVRVVAIDGLLLEVEPLEGAARDAGH